MNKNSSRFYSKIEFNSIQNEIQRDFRVELTRIFVDSTTKHNVDSDI